MTRYWDCGFGLNILYRICLRFRTLCENCFLLIMYIVLQIFVSYLQRNFSFYYKHISVWKYGDDLTITLTMCRICSLHTASWTSSLVGEFEFMSEVVFIHTAQCHKMCAVDGTSGALGVVFCMFCRSDVLRSSCLRFGEQRVWALRWYYMIVCGSLDVMCVVCADVAGRILANWWLNAKRPPRKVWTVVGW